MSNGENTENQPPQKLKGDDLSGLSVEEKHKRIRDAQKALRETLLSEARAMTDGNSSAFTRKH